MLLNSTHLLEFSMQYKPNIHSETPGIPTIFAFKHLCVLDSFAIIPAD